VSGETCRSGSRALLQRTVKVASAAADRLHPSGTGVVALLYHRVGGASSLEIDLDPSRFDEQIAVIAASGRAVPLGDALARLATPAAAAADAESVVVVTFDDGTADFADVAVPILVRYQVPATLYLATAFVDGDRAFPAAGQPISWSALRDACATGLVDVGSHTDTHRLLDRISAADAAEELDRSIDLIGTHLGQQARDFAYPKAVPGTPDVARLVRDRFRSAALAGTRVNAWRGTDPYRLARSPIQVADGMQFFARKLAGGMTLEDSLRRALNRIRYAKART
jgi:peptidoglycan/xylan/chitin deacetylase (PgdA/CDA1 family)